MLIYRVEHKESGFGPYNAMYHAPFYNVAYKCNHLQNILWSYFINRNHSEPKGNYIGKDVKFGFANLRQFSKWFDNVNGIYELQKLGFVLRSYEVSKHIQEKNQVAFYPDHATLVESSTIIDGFNKSFIEEYSKMIKCNS